MPSQHLPEASIFLLLLTLSACHSPMYLYCWEKKNIFRYAMLENRSRWSRTLPITGRGGEVLGRQDIQVGCGGTLGSSGRRLHQWYWLLSKYLNSYCMTRLKRSKRSCKLQGYPLLLYLRPIAHATFFPPSLSLSALRLPPQNIKICNNHGQNQANPRPTS